MNNELITKESLINQIQDILSQARTTVAAEVNTQLLNAYWNVGRLIVLYEQ